jgi:hypothetical protein
MMLSKIVALMTISSWNSIILDSSIPKRDTERTMDNSILLIVITMTKKA